MKKLLPLFVGIFAAALAAGAGFGYRRAQLIAEMQLAAIAADSSKGQELAVDSSATDSTQAIAGDSATVGEDVPRVLGASDDPVGAARAAESSIAAMTVDSGAVAEAVASPTEQAPQPKVATTAAATHASADSTPTVPVRRLAKIIGGMPPRDAAKVLSGLQDDELRALLAYLSDRQASAIMSAIPPERAAQIASSTMRASGGVR